MVHVIPAEIIQEAIQSFTGKSKGISPAECNEKVNNCQVDFIKLHLTSFNCPHNLKKENVVVVGRM